MAWWSTAKVNGVSLNDPRWKPYIDNDGVFTWNGVTIKPSGSIRVGETKIHPSGLVQVADKVHVEGVVYGRLSELAKIKSGSSTVTTTTVSGHSTETARSVLSENSTKANVQRKSVTISGKDGEREPDKSTQVAGNKRKSTDVGSDSAKKQKMASIDPASTSTEQRNPVESAPSAPKNIHDIELPEQRSDNVPVYESCDQVRRRIEARLLQGGVTKAQFCRDLTDQLYSFDGPAKIQSNMLDAFRKKRGPTSGCTSSVYYAAYVYFEKWRIVQNEAKCKHRLDMEKIWPAGVERDRDDSKRGVWCARGERPRQDSYGRWKFH